MTLSQTQQLIEMLRSSGVEYYKTQYLELRFTNHVDNQPVTPPQQSTFHAPVDVRQADYSYVTSVTNIPPANAVPPTEANIPHHTNEVLSMLRLDDNSLVDKLFPDYTKVE
jgi:hypothetical protein